MNFIFRLIVLVLVGRKFLRLAVSQKKEPSRYALIGAASYLIPTLTADAIIAVAVGSQTDGLEMITYILPTPIGLFVAWIAYNVLTNTWVSQKPSRKAKARKETKSVISVEKAHPASTVNPVSSNNPSSKIHFGNTVRRTESDRRDEGSRYNKNER